MLIFQGLDDRVVPPSQLDAMEAAFEPRGIPYVAMRFEGEGHGFRKAESRRATYDGRARVPRPRVRVHAGDDVPPLEIPGLDAFAAAMAGAAAGGDLR